MSRQQAVSKYTRILTQWPIDRFRPENVHFQRVLQKRIDTEGSNSSPNEAQQVIAAESLLSNAFSKRYPLTQRFMRPASEPEHYTRLEQELEEAPSRSWLGRVYKRLQGMVRFQ